MKNYKSLLVSLVIILIIALAWVLIISRTIDFNQLIFSDKNISKELSGEEKKYQEVITYKKNNCKNDNGIWIDQHEMCYREDVALEMQNSCKNFNGTWIENSRIYECEINGEIFKFGEWEIIEWEMYEKMKKSCFNYNGEWLGGIDMACIIDGSIFYVGRWAILDDSKNSCVDDFGGQWLGGEKLECLIDGHVYPGNWVHIFSMKDSCEKAGGFWLGGDDNVCQIGNQIYRRQAWERINEMKNSCENIGGIYIGGDSFACDWNQSIYLNKDWERVVKVPDMGERCTSDGGNWNEEIKACQGLEKNWCDNILVELNLKTLGWDGNNLSCFIY